MKKVKIVLDWFPNTVHTGLLLAQKKGYFAEAGVEVEIFGEPHNIMDFHGADMICGPATSMLVNMMEGTDMTAVATFTQKCDSGIVSLKEAGITSPAKLEGKRLTHWTLPWFHALVGDAVRSDGGDYSKIELVPMNVPDILGVLGHIADATWVYEYWENQVLKLAGKEINYFAFADVDPKFDFCAPALGATRQLVEEHPDAIRALLYAADRGYQEAALDPDGSVMAVKEFMPAGTPDQVLLDGQRHLAEILLDETGHWGYIKPERWDPMADFMIQSGLYDKRRPTEYTNEFLPR